MAKQRTPRLRQAPRVQTHVTIELTGEEICALDALVGYGTDAFLEVFYKHMGKHYLQPHEAGLRSLFDTVRSDLLPIMARDKAARQAFALADPEVRSREGFRQALDQAYANGKLDGAKESASTAKGGA